MQCTNKCPPLICSSVKHRSNSKIAELETTFLVNQDIGSWEDQYVSR